MPSLTQRGKSSTDINLVLDAMDALSGAAHIEEFFVASADADFTSLVQRFRAADRMTTVIAAGAVAFAYREMADSVVESHDFVAILNGTAADAPRLVRSAKPATSQPAAPLTPGPATTAAAEVLALVRAAPGPVTGSVAAHRALAADPSLKTDWGGTGSSALGLPRPARALPTRQPLAGLGLGCGAVLTGPAARRREARPAIEEQIIRVTDVPALSSGQYRQVFVSLEAKLREHLATRAELAKA